MATVDITDNSAEVRAALEQAKARALEIIGGKIESYAKQELSRPKSGHKTAPDPRPNVDTGALRNSITHAVDGDTVIVGSSIHYAPYIELGTGKEYSPPPEWMENNAEQGAGIRKGGIKAWPFLRPAVENHTNEYKKVIETELKNA